MTTVDATQGFAHELHDAVNLDVDVFEADFRERIAVLVDVHGTWTGTTIGPPTPISALF